MTGVGGRLVVLDGIFDDYGQAAITFGLDCFDLFPQGIVDFSGYLDCSSSHIASLLSLDDDALFRSKHIVRNVTAVHANRIVSELFIVDIKGDIVLQD